MADHEQGEESVSYFSESSPFLLRSGDHPPLSKKQQKIGQAQFLTLCWSIFLLGWNDGTIGPLLPRIQEVYHVRPSRIF